MSVDDRAGSGAAASISGAGITAVLAAGQRAAESRRADALFDDPLAEAVVADAAGIEFAGIPVRDDRLRPPSAMLQSVADAIATRTVWIDRRVLRAAAAGIRQIVTLGSGLDDRAGRLPLPAGMRVFEVDAPEVLACKRMLVDRVHGDGDHRVLVPADLREDWLPELERRGFDRRRRTVWVLEGLLYYLSRDDGDRLLALAADASAPGSALATEYPLDYTAALRGLAAFDERPIAVSESSETVLRVAVEAAVPDPHDRLVPLGWSEVRTERLADAAAAVGRVVPPPWDHPSASPAWWLAEAHRS